MLLTPRFEHSAIPLEMTGILPETTRGRSALEVSRLRIREGNRMVEVGELFDVIAQPAHDDDLAIVARSNMTRIGAGMTWGRLSVEGTVGMNAGAGMKGGSLLLQHAGDWLGAEMSGGAIHVSGNAGSQVGAAYRGSRHGMTGGTIEIHGDAGDEVGLLLRRGFIHIHGHCGAFAGASMIAGTILCDKSFGPNPGAGMKRGTLITREPITTMAPGFRYCCDYEPSMLPMLVRDRVLKMVRCYRGDLMTGGRGELWQIV